MQPVHDLYILKINGSKCARGLDPLYGDACSAKSFKVLALIFSTDCSPIDWLQSVLKIRSFENVFISFLNFFQASRFLGGLDHLGNIYWKIPMLGGLDHLI